jgi:hypothetical protein
MKKILPIFFAVLCLFVVGFDFSKHMGVVMNGRAKAYPIKILNWHEAVNDEAGGVKFLVTW